jgi:hypothetical protein
VIPALFFTGRDWSSPSASQPLKTAQWWWPVAQFWM